MTTDKQPQTDSRQITIKVPARPRLHLSPDNALKGFAVLLLLVLSFFGGVLFQKGHQPKTTAVSGQMASTTNRSLGQNGRYGGSGFGGGMNRGFTTSPVTAISATSITVTASGVSKTYAITSDTTITDNGQQVDTTAITVGSNVIVIASRTDASTASRIIVNPPATSGNSTTTPLNTQSN